MSGLLQDRVYTYVLDNPGQTAEAIALAIRARRQSVEAVLKDSDFFTVNNGSNRAKTYTVSVATGRRGTARNRPTHKQRVLALLDDRRPHTHRELYALHVIAHSRIADLRADGYLIAQWRDGDDYLYQLVGTLDDGASTRAGGTAPSSSGPRTDGLLREPPYQEQAGAAQQLSLISGGRGAYGEAA